MSYIKKMELSEAVEFEDDREIAALITGLLCFAMSRPFVKREQKQLTTSG